MQARIRFTVNYEVVQEIEEPSELLNVHELAEQAAQLMCDEVTECNAVAVYKIRSITVRCE